jgi:chromosome transmission fidelity protein 18
MTSNIKTLLFADKYKPKSYSDLLTDEKTNREILTWMKSWDEIVFNRKFTIPKIPIIQNINNQNKNYLNKSKKIVNSNSQNLNEKNNINQIEYYEVEYVQSKHKIILISGPPGIGKTTMANIISRQCGYEPIIINSSDERTADKLITRIYDTTLINNLNLSKKINLLVLI